MLNRLFQRLAGVPRKLKPEQARALARDFLQEWPPLQERELPPAELSVEAVTDERRRTVWRATAMLAFDLRCSVMVDDAEGRVVEARVVALRAGSDVAHWKASD